MKSNLLRTFFEWALITSVLMSVLFFGWYLVKSRQARAYDSQIAQAQLRLQNGQNMMAALQAACQMYARTNADLAKFLAPPAAAPAPAPSASAPAKGGK